MSKEVNLLLLGILPWLGHSHKARQHLGKAYQGLQLGFSVHAPLADNFMGIAECLIRCHMSCPPHSSWDSTPTA